MNADEALAAIETDASFACPARLADQALSFYVPVFAYEFNDENAPEIFLPPVSYPYGAAHESELQYFFPAEDLAHLPGPPPQLRAGQRELSEKMMRYWTQFAKNGDPNGPQTPDWTEYAPSRGEFQSLAPLLIAPEADFAASHRCDFWATLFSAIADQGHADIGVACRGCASIRHAAATPAVSGSCGGKPYLTRAIAGVD